MNRWCIFMLAAGFALTIRAGERPNMVFILVDAIGETKDLASVLPEAAQSMASMVDDYYARNDALGPKRNRAYQGRTVGVWSAMGRGRIAADRGALVLKADQGPFDARTNVTPSLDGSAWIEFEARSEKEKNQGEQALLD